MTWRCVTFQGPLLGIGIMNIFHPQSVPGVIMEYQSLLSEYLLSVQITSMYHFPWQEIQKFYWTIAKPH